MAKRGLVNPETHKTEDWNGDEGIYAARAVEQYDAKAFKKPMRPLSRGLKFSLWHHRIGKNS